MSVHAAPGLFDALVKADAVRLTAALERGESLTATDAHGQTPLHWAVRLERHALLPILLRAGAPVDALDHDGHSPLHFAVLHQAKGEDVPALLAAHAHPQSRNARGESVAYAALNRGNRAIFEMLAPHINPDAPATPALSLRQAVQRQRPEWAAFLKPASLAQAMGPAGSPPLAPAIAPRPSPGRPRLG